MGYIYILYPMTETTAQVISFLTELSELKTSFIMKFLIYHQGSLYPWWYMISLKQAKICLSSKI